MDGFRARATKYRGRYAEETKMACGESLTSPLRAIPANAGREATLVPGPGVRVSDDKLHFFASGDGYAHLNRDKLTVFVIQEMRGDLESGEHVFPAGVVVQGSVRGG